MSTLERAIQIATEAHNGQLDKAGRDYIGHPLRVMAMGKTGNRRLLRTKEQFDNQQNEETGNIRLVAAIL